VFGYRYGTPKAPVKQALREGRDILFDIDWQGARQLEPDFGEHLVTIFLLPPSMEELERRLTARGTDSAEVIAERMRRAADEIDHWAEYQYVLVNYDMDECLERGRAIGGAERSKRVRQTDLQPFGRDLIVPQPYDPSNPRERAAARPETSLSRSAYHRRSTSSECAAWPT
jgi:guanylate kinase